MGVKALTRVFIERLLRREQLASACVLGLLLSFAILPDSASAWQVFRTNPGSFSTVYVRASPPSGTILTSVPLNGTQVWSTGERWSGWGPFTGGTESWLKVYYNGVWGWSFDQGGGYDTYVYVGVTSTPWSSPTSPASGSSVSAKRPPLRWNYGDPDGGAQDGANIQIATDSGFGNLLRNGGTSLGAYNPDWDLAAGQYWWRVQTHSWINGWGAWSAAATFIVRHATTVAGSCTPAAPMAGTPVKVTVAVTRSGGAAAPVGIPVSLQASPDGQAWSALGSGTTGAGGLYEYTFTPSQKTYLRASTSDTAWDAAATSAVFSVTPIALQPVTVTGSASPSSILSGATVKTSWTVKDTSGAGVSGVPITIQQSGDGTNWTALASGTTGSGGIFEHSFAPAKSVQVRAVTVATSTYLAGTSGAVPISVSLQPVTITGSVNPPNPLVGANVNAVWTVTGADGAGGRRDRIAPGGARAAAHAGAAQGAG